MIALAPPSFNNYFSPMLAKLPTKTITVPDHEKTGEMMRARRIQAKKSLRYVAQKLGFSAPYVFDLEKGKRAWTEEKAERYLEALK